MEEKSNSPNIKENVLSILLTEDRQYIKECMKEIELLKERKTVRVVLEFSLDEFPNL